MSFTFNADGEIPADGKWMGRRFWVGRAAHSEQMRIRSAEPAGTFDEFVAPLDYPMFIVTAGRRRRHDGCLVGFATQTSIDPPRLLVCLSRANATARTARRSRFLAVHQVSDQHGELARLFAEESGDWTDKFARCHWRRGPHGVRILEDCSAWMVGKVIRRLDLGDHVGFLLAPQAGMRLDDDPPLTLKGAEAFDPGHPA